MDVRKTYGTDRADGRFLSTMGLTHALLAHLEPALAFRADFTPAEIETWRVRVRSKLLELMAFPRAPPQPVPRRLWSERRDGYRLEKWEAYPEPHSVVPYLLLVPDGIDASSPGPAVMCFPGSASSKELLAGEPELRSEQPPNAHPERNTMALWYARAGITAVVVENPGTAELDETPNDPARVNTGRDKLSAELIAMGRSYLGLSVYQKMHILGWLKTVPLVDRRRIALSGHSLGTEPAMVMAVLDPEVKALVFNDFLCNNLQRYVVTALPLDGAWRHINPVWHIVPGFLASFDFPDLLAAVAPRPLLFTEGGITLELDRVRRAYETLGAAGSLEVHYYPRYRDAASRKHDRERMPEGLTQEEYFEYANVDVPDHAFKKDLAVPWLRGTL